MKLLCGQQSHSLVYIPKEQGLYFKGMHAPYGTVCSDRGMGTAQVLISRRFAGEDVVWVYNYSAMGRNGILLFAAACMDLEGICLVR